MHKKPDFGKTCLLCLLAFIAMPMGLRNDALFGVVGAIGLIAVWRHWPEEE